VVGQDHALGASGSASAGAGLDARRARSASFSCPGGVGKTETAIALADTLCGGERNMTVISMSEFKEEHTVALLKGAPPVTSATARAASDEAVESPVRGAPVEKAHRGVLELFYQVFDKGQLDDSEGRTIDFKNTVILLGSNLGTDTIMKLCADPETRPEPEGLGKEIRPALLTFFAPALLGRMIVVPYYPIADDVMRRIVALKLGKVAARPPEPPHGAGVRRHRGAADRCPLHRGGQRSAQRRPHHHRHAAAGDLTRAARPDGERRHCDPAPGHGRK
jgi:type VI secretion system protein VasG